MLLLHQLLIRSHVFRCPNTIAQSATSPSRLGTLMLFASPIQCLAQVDGHVEGMRKVSFRTSRNPPLVPLPDAAITGEAEVPALKKATVGHFWLSVLIQN